MGKNSNFLTVCKFVKPLQFGLLVDDGIRNPFGEDRFETWPHPQLLRGRGQTLLCGAETIQEIDEADWSVGEVVKTYDFDMNSRKFIVPGDVWHMADFASTFFLFNGSCTIIKPNLQGMFGGDNRYLVDDERTIMTGVDFRGRLVLGGFDPENFWGDAWNAVWGEWTSKFGFGIDLSIEIAENFVFWSSTGGGDTLHLFMPQLAQDGVISEARPLGPVFLESWRSNSIGFMPMPWQGTVLMVKPLGNAVVAYGDNGIAALPSVLDPTPTLGMEQLTKFGIPSRGAAGGSDTEHIFLDETGTLWSMGMDFKPKRLGYEEYLADLIGSDIVIVYHEQLKEYYISGEDSSGEQLSFILTPAGLSRSPHQITSGYFTGGDFIGVGKTDEDTEVLIVTGEVDFKYRDIKTITTVELGLDTDLDPYTGIDVSVAIDYKYSTDTEWKRSPFHKVNDQGWTRVQITAVDFRLVIKLSNYTNFKLSYANLKWQPSGRQTRRGLSDNQANA